MRTAAGMRMTRWDENDKRDVDDKQDKNGSRDLDDKGELNIFVFR